MKNWILKNKRDVINLSSIFLTFIVIISIAVLTQKGDGPFNPVAFSIFGAPVAWYAVFILTGIISATILGLSEFKRKGIDVDHLYDGLLIFVPASIIGARLFYVIFDNNNTYDSFLEVIGFRDGTFQLAGLAIHGAIIVVAVGLIFFAKYKKISYWTLLDIVAPGLLIGQIMGRWGNFMNQEAFGPIIQSQWVIDILPNFIVQQMTTIRGVQHPTFLYESMLNLVLFIFLIIIRRKRVFKEGDMVGLYFIWYGLVRGIAIEPFRQDPLIIFNVIRVNQWVSSPALIIAGVLIIIIKNKLKPNLSFYADLDMVEKEKEVN